jgi:acetyl-CoA carboxylase carboxyltransferase component
MDESIRERIKQIRDVKVRAFKGGGDEKIALQHQKGKLTARERMELLLDKDSLRRSTQTPYVRLPLIGG